jgi:hypothetical protein
MNRGRPKRTSKESTINPLRKRLYSLQEAAIFLGRTEWGMRELIWAGDIPVVRQDGGRKIYLDVEDLNAYVERNKSTYL